MMVHQAFSAALAGRKTRKFIEQTGAQMYQSAAFVSLRSLCRRIGLTKVVWRILHRDGNEVKYGNQLLSYVRASDVVFDVGASVGDYTRHFLAKVIKGQVHAFEPLPKSCDVLKTLDAASRLCIHQCAVGAVGGRAVMYVGGSGPDGRASVHQRQGKKPIEVDVKTLDDIVSTIKTIPNVVKIDVEGFELEVLKGMTYLLQKMELCVIALEVHFRILESKGMSQVPKEIVRILRSHHFTVRWPDVSHIIAVRGR